MVVFEFVLVAVDAVLGAVIVVVLVVAGLPLTWLRPRLRIRIYN